VAALQIGFGMNAAFGVTVTPKSVDREIEDQ
jgi:hypothetical protein